VNKFVKTFWGKVKVILANRSLMKKSIAVHVTIIGVPVMVFALYTYKSLERNAKKDAIEKRNYEINVEYDTIEKNMYIMRNIINTVTHDKELLDFIAHDGDRDTRELINFSDTKYKQLIGLQNNNPAIKQINIFTRNLQENEFWPIIYMENRVEHNDWYKKVLGKNGVEYWNINHYDNDIKTKSMFNEVNYELVVSLNKAIKHSGSNLGVVRVTMVSKDFFPSMFKEEQDGQTFVIDKENLNLISDKDNKLLKTYSFDPEQFKQFIGDKLLKERGEIDYKQGKEEYIVLYRESPMVNNYIVNVIPLKKITQGIETSRQLLLWGGILLLVFLSIIIYFATKALLRRFYKILSAVKQVRNGELMPSIPVYGTDEVGVLAHNFRQMMKTIDTLINESINREVMTKEAELKALKTQIDAHFLYNTLENIRMMAVVEENYMISDCLANLGDMMRYNMRWNNEFVPLSEEISHIKNYISLMTLRYDNQIILNINIMKEFMSKEILKLTIQPLVENAVKHGLADKLRSEDGSISISVEIDQQFLYLSVMDNGKGMDKNKVLELQNHIDGNVNDKFGLGLKNVNDRIKLFYNDQCGIIVESQEGTYTKITMKLPREGKGILIAGIDEIAKI
jgi:two-component system sensor histidine kinase YesM